MFQAFEGVFGILLIVAVGYYLSQKRFMDTASTQFLTKLAAKIAIPCMLFNNAITNFTIDFLRSTGWGLLIPFCVIVILHGVAYISALLLRLPSSDRGVFCAMISMPNTLSIGLPITLAIFGTSGIPYVMAFYVATALFFWGFAVKMIARDAGIRESSRLEAIKKIFTPPLLAFLLGAAINMTGINMPKSFLIATGNLGAMTTPLTLLLTGSILAEMGREAFRLDKTGIITLLGRLALSPVVCLVICLGASLPHEITENYTVQSGLPSMNQVMLMSKYYGANQRLCAQMLTLTTLLSLLSIPMVILVLTYI